LRPMLLLLQHGRALALDGALKLVGDLRQRPGERYFQTRVIFRDVDRAVRGLAERPDAELQPVVRPGFPLDRKDLPELRPGGFQPGFQAAGRLLPPESMGNGNDQGRGHRRAPVGTREGS